MPKRSDIKSVLIIGAGPIIIGQACEFDYSGAQACKALKEEGIRVILINSNPATIMTDPMMADATYIEPIEKNTIEKIIEIEKPDAVLPTMGGQTALNATLELFHSGILKKHNIEIIGAKPDSINKAEDRELFKQSMTKIGLESARAKIAKNIDEALLALNSVGLPAIIRPSFTLGGEGGGIAYNNDEFLDIVLNGLKLSPTSEVLIEESLLGWKEYEMEVVRDNTDNCIIICSIENVDPMGVHTGDSISVAPALTLTDKEYQRMRNASIAVLREIGVDTGGSNVQFALNPVDGRLIVIEMNPRVSRSSALASKATGFPIAKIAAKLAIGYTLDEIPNDITKVTPASFEPTLDYIVVKAPRFAFEKFPAADPTLTTTMKSVGEAMAIGRTFTQALQKALRSLEKRGSSFHWGAQEHTKAELLELIATPTDKRVVQVQQALRLGATAEEVFEQTKIDPWFIDQIVLINEIADWIASLEVLDAASLRKAKKHGFSDSQLAQLRGVSEEEIRAQRYAEGVRPVFKTVDTCAGEFPALTPYHYSSYDQVTEVVPSDRQKVVILGSGPNRIGQGVEFDYSCVHAAFALREAGYETIMVNCNPETVSTDYDTSDRLYFEPLTLEDVLEVIHAESQSGKLLGVMVQLGGQTALGLANGLEAAGVPILGTTPEAIDKAEERGAFQRILDDAGLISPANGTATNLEESVEIAKRIGYPVLVRPSFVLGGRGMEIVYDEKSLEGYFDRIAEHALVDDTHPLLVDHFLDDAIEIDIDALYDGQRLYVGGVMEHIEEAGIHSGDSSCTLPPITLSDAQIERVAAATEAIAKGLGVKGLINVQFALASDVLYVLEANPRASRTVPFVSKALGITLAKAASLVMIGRSIDELIKDDHLPAADGKHLPSGTPVSVKEAVLPFKRFATKDGRYVDSLLGPEMRSTGEVMGIDKTFPAAFAKSQAGAGSALPLSGSVFVSVADRDKPQIILPVARLSQMGYRILATEGTARMLERHGIAAETVIKHSKAAEGQRSIVQMITDGEVDVVVNTPSGAFARVDGYEI